MSDITHSPITEMNKALQVENERLRAALAECQRERLRFAVVVDKVAEMTDSGAIEIPYGTEGRWTFLRTDDVAAARRVIAEAEKEKP